MARIAAVGTALPGYRYNLAEMRTIGAQWLGEGSGDLALFERFVSSSKLQHRYFAMPAKEILSLNGLHGRTNHFESLGPALGTRALTEAMQRAAVRPDEIDRLLFTSCSCPSIPAIDGLIMEQAGLRRTTARMPIYQHGCAGGVVGLGMACDLASLGKPVALTSVELCSLVFHREKPTPAELVGSAIFADGASSAIVLPGSGGLTFRARESFLIPNSRHLMGYELLDDGFHLKLDRELPQILAEHAPQRTRAFLRTFGMEPKDIAHWLFHPGGVKILDYLEHAFELRPEQAPWSRDVLSEIGNLSSSTVLFVLSRFLHSQVAKVNDFALMVGVGPGLTFELILFEYLAPAQ